MKICMFTNTYLPHVGGVARSVSTFVEELRNMDHEVLVVAPTFPGQENEGSESRGVLRVPAMQNFNGSDFSVSLIVPDEIEEKIVSFAPDIIHSHHPFLLGDAALRTARSLFVPLVFTHHTFYDQYTHYVPLDSRAMKRFVIQLVTEYANLCNGVIAPSKSVGEVMKKRGITAPIREVPTGIDMDLFASGSGDSLGKKLNINGDAKIIGHLGRLAHEKNLVYLARAVGRYLQQERDALFVVAGKGEAEKDIREIFQSMHIIDRLKLVGVLEGGELADFYHLMDLFVFASHSETQGLVLAEAMAAGVPVIALDASGAREVVEDGKNGYLLPADSTAAAFAGAMERYFQLPDADRQSMKSGAAGTAARFSRRNCAEKLLAFYEQTRNTYNGSHKVHPSVSTLEQLAVDIRTEWDLISEKANALIHTFTNANETDGSEH